MKSCSTLDRRTFLARAAALGGAAAFAPLLPAWAQSGTRGLKPDMPTLSGEAIALRIDHIPFIVGGRPGPAVTINGTVPEPLILFKERHHVRMPATNSLEAATSIP